MAYDQGTTLLGLEDSVALVTGAGSGIGHATAIQLARAGCDVAVADLDADSAQLTADEIIAIGRRSVSFPIDVRDPDAVDNLVSATRDALGPLDVAVNVVGGPLITKPFLDLTLEDWNRVIELNLLSAVTCGRAEAISMIKDGQRGRIVNVSSSSGITSAPNVAPYGASKAAIIHMTKSMGVELAPYGIRVNCVVPGTHSSERTRKIANDPSSPAGVREFWVGAAKAPPLGRLGDPFETAGVAVFLASNLSEYVTGHIVISDGGILHTTARPAVGGAIKPEALSSMTEFP